MRKEILNLNYNPTVFIVSQRASSVMSADKIIVLDDGSVCGVGNHNQLLEQCDVYKEIYTSQFERRIAMNNKSIPKKVFSYIGRYKYVLFLSLLLAVLSVGLTLYVPVLVGNAIDFIIGKGKVDFDSVIKILFKILIIVAITGLLQWIMNVCKTTELLFNVVRDMRNRAFKKIEVLPFSYLDSHSQGDTVSKVITDADQLADGLLMDLLSCLRVLQQLLVRLFLCFQLISG